MDDSSERRVALRRGPKGFGFHIINADGNDQWKEHWRGEEFRCFDL